MSSYPRGSEPPCVLGLPGCAGIIRNRGAQSCAECARAKQRRVPTAFVPVAPRPTPETSVASTALLPDALAALLRKAPASIVDLATRLQATQGQVLDALLSLKDAGANLHQFGEQWSLEKQPARTGRVFEYTSRPDHTFIFGVASDQHLGSKYARLDVLNDLYDWFAARKVDRVFNAGNWIDGEDEKNRQDIAVHGFEPQIDYFAKTYPARAGLTTYAVWGEDHEGWFARRESIDVGRFAERRMRDAGREDWIDLGFMEAKIDLVNAQTGVKTSMLVMHPGGGTAYALSYRPQKLVESLQGGEKPAAILIGHYHKISVNLIRSVWAFQVGCQQDQTPFMRKIPTEPHIGGLIVTLTQDPATGALTGCVPEIRQYFASSYYNDRWSKSGAPNMRPLDFVGPR